MKPRNVSTLALLIGLFLVSAGLHAAPCPASDSVLCLSAQRFSVEVNWRDFAGNTGTGRAVRLTPDTGYFWFFSDNNVELVVKVLDARAFNGRIWVFFGALSNVEYTLRVTDTQTGSVKEYRNPSGQFASVGDTAAFTGAATGPTPSYESVTAEGTGTPPESLEAIRRFVDAAASDSASEIRTNKAATFTPCPGPSTSLFLSNCRFELSVEWTDFQGHTGSGKAVQLTPDTGYFWFFSDNNVELIIKVLDARSFNEKFWVFYGALSNVEYSLHVRDTVSGALRIYRNPSSNFASVGDTSAFRGGYGIGVTLDSARASSGEITVANGGTISATAGDGTVFTLEIPPNAFFSDKTVTMTPVAAIEGLPFSGGLVAAVDLQPSGVYLLDGARLTIHTPSPVSEAEETAFAWNGSGQDFFLYPPVAANGDLQMSISHLGGYGVARGTEAERQTQSGKEPVSEDDRLSHRIALILRDGRSEARGASTATALRATDSEWRTRLTNFLEQIYAGSLGLRDQMQVARDPDEVVSVDNQLRRWVNAVSSSGLGDRLLAPSRSSEIFTLLEGMFRRALIVIHTRCNADVTAINDLPRIVALTRKWGLNLQDLVDAALRCLNFQLRFDSTIVTTVRGAEGRVNITHAVTASFPLHYSGSYASTGMGDISFRSFSVSANGTDCSANSSGTTKGTFTADLDLSPNADLGKVGGLTQAKLSYDPGRPLSPITVTCPDVGSVNIPLTWADAFALFHALDVERSYYVARYLQQTGSKTPWATKSYGGVRSIVNMTTAETTFIYIDHTPQ